MYRISANSFRRNYSFLKKILCTVTFDHSTYRCGNYSRAETICGNTVALKKLLAILNCLSFLDSFKFSPQLSFDLSDLKKLHQIKAFFTPIKMTYGLALKSKIFQYYTLARWDERLIQQVSDVPSIIFLIISCKILCKNYFNLISYFS